MANKAISRSVDHPGRSLEPVYKINSVRGTYPAAFVDSTIGICINLMSALTGSTLVATQKGIKIRTQIVNTTSIFAEHLTLPFPLGDGTGVKSGTPKGFVFGVTSTEV